MLDFSGLVDGIYQNPRDAGGLCFFYLLVYMSVGWFVCVTRTGQTKNETGLKIDIHSRLDSI